MSWTWAEIVIHCVVIGVGIPAAFRNPTALFLVASWAFGQGVWMATGINLPLKAYFIADLTVIALIYAKTIARLGPKEYTSVSEQLKCLLTDLPWWDRIIVGLFVAGCWPAYGLTMDEWTRWHLLWAITILQFLLAGGEALTSRRGAKRAIPVEPDRPTGGLQRVAGNWGYG